MAAATSEGELGTTEDPRALVAGDPAALAATEQRLAGMATAFGRTADALGRVQIGRWQGAAADAFRTRFPDATGQWSAAQEAFARAASGWHSYREIVGWAQERAAEAIARHRAGVAASQEAVAARAAAVEGYNRGLAEADAGRAPLPEPLPAFVDPGPERVAAARALLADARQQRDAVADQVAGVLQAAAALAPESPSGWDASLATAGDLVRGGLDGAGRFLGSLAEGGEGLLRLARSVNPADPWNAMHPAQYGEAVSTAAAGLVSSAVHPVRVVGDLLGPGWGTDPAAAAGRALPGVLATMATGGALRGRAPATGGMRFNDPRPAAEPFAPREDPAAGNGNPPPSTPAAAAPPVPAGFTGPAEFRAFGETIHRALEATFPDTRVAMRGSAVTGFAHDSGLPFDTVPHRSDYDMALAGDTVFDAARDAGLRLRGGKVRTGPLTDYELAELGLGDLARQLSDRTGRDVSFMIYRGIDDIAARGPYIEVPPP